MITIIDYDAGNIKSVANMLQAIGIASRIAGSPAEIASAEKLILPGVGHFDHGMAELRRRGLIDALNRRVLGDGVPVLGICLGAQILTRGSDEGHEPGLGWIDGCTVGFDCKRLDATLRVPHMGWADTWALSPNPLSTGLPEDARYYYVHGFHIVCDTPSQAIFAARHGYDFVAGVQKSNILGVQFHPEKSHRYGMHMLRNFAAWRPDGAGNATS